jgi:SAM-dependent methyltransferase
MSGPTLSAVGGLEAAAAELRAHRYTWPVVRDRTGLSWRLPFPLSRLDEVDTPHMTDDERPPVDWLIRLLLLGDEIADERLEAILSGSARDALERAGLLERRAGATSSRALLLPWEEFLLACDWPWLDTSSRVIAPDPSSVFTAEHVAPLPGEPAGSAVDVGTGCGIIAFVAARHFDRVAGVDTNARAISFARFNAALNGVDASFSECSTAFLAEELDAPVDLVTFVLPVLFPRFWRRAAPAYVSQVEPGVDGRRLVVGVYRDLPGALRPGGRALLFHQVPIDDDLTVWLRESGAGDRLTVVANPLSRPGARWAYARISAHRAGAGSLRVVPSPAHVFGPPQSRVDLLRHLATERMLADARDLGDAVVRLHDWAEATTVAAVDGGTVAPGVTTLDEQPLGGDDWAFLRSLDGHSTVAELQARDDHHDLQAIARRLAAAGLVWVERRGTSPLTLPGSIP